MKSCLSSALLLLTLVRYCVSAAVPDAVSKLQRQLLRSEGEPEEIQISNKEMQEASKPQEGDGEAEKNAKAAVEQAPTGKITEDATESGDAANVGNASATHNQ